MGRFKKLYEEAGEWLYAFIHILPTHDGEFGHGWTNRWVEGARASPYFAGHLDAVLYPILLILVLVGFYE